MKKEIVVKVAKTAGVLLYYGIIASVIVENIKLRERARIARLTSNFQDELLGITIDLAKHESTENSKLRQEIEVLKQNQKVKK